MIIGIVGLGLIGGSLGLDFRNRGHQVLGVSRQQITIKRALERGVVDEASCDLSLLSSAEVIFLCPPLRMILPTLQALLPHLNPGTIVTDVGSVKTAIAEAGDAIWPKFIGGHPMAGTAEQGIEAAQRGLFEGAAYVLTPTDHTNRQDLEILTQLIQGLGARLHTCSPPDHDQAVAWISHLPVMISASLIASTQQEADPKVLALAHQLASSGFRDTSRVGGGNPELGRMMAQFNGPALLHSLTLYRQELERVTELIALEQWDALQNWLAQTHGDRQKFL